MGSEAVSLQVAAAGACGGGLDFRRCSSPGFSPAPAMNLQTGTRHRDIAARPTPEVRLRYSPARYVASPLDVARLRYRTSSLSRQSRP
ncbi:hypothetical protein CFB82_25385 [Burkholderia sp. HI2714]|nr:hypothetical protein CFB82_25385 [Burkholderia sp. HI2714]